MAVRKIECPKTIPHYVMLEDRLHRACRKLALKYGIGFCMTRVIGSWYLWRESKPLMTSDGWVFPPTIRYTKSWSKKGLVF